MFPPPKHQDWATLYDKFWSDLMNANKQIDAIAHGAQDWPGTAVS